MSNYLVVQWQVLVEMAEQQLPQQASQTEMMAVTSQLATLYTSRYSSLEQHSNVTIHNLFVSNSYNKHLITIIPLSSQSLLHPTCQHITMKMWCVSKHTTPLCSGKQIFFPGNQHLTKPSKVAWKQSQYRPDAQPMVKWGINLSHLVFHKEAKRS